MMTAPPTFPPCVVLASLGAPGYNVERMRSTRITWRDVLEMPEDGRRYEAIEGELYVTPPPKSRHQWVSARLFGALFDLLVKPGHGMLFHAPTGVEFPDTEEGVQPDLLFLSSERLHIVGEDWVRVAPDLVIEITSPSTAKRDRTVKRRLYERHGVPEYWVVDPEAQQVEVWRFAARATQPERCTERVPVRLGERVLDELELARIFDWPG